MCDPVTASIALAVTSVAATGASIIGQMKSADAQAKAINQQLENTQEANRKAASSEMFDQMRGARREQAKIRTAAGEAGLSLSSGSIEALLFDSAMQMEMAGGRTIANMESRNEAAQDEATSMMSQVQKPTLLGAGLQLGAAAASGWSGIQNAKIQVRKAGEA